MGHILAITGDHHVNSTVGLFPPSYQLDDGQPVGQSDRQRWIWRQWLRYWKTVQSVRDKFSWPVTSIMLGELVDDNYHKTSQLITRNKADILAMGYASLEPVLDIVTDDIIVLRGTEAHVGRSSNLDEEMAKNIGATKSPLGTSSWWQFRATFEGVTIDAAHHPGTRSQVPHTAGNEANRLASKVFYAYSTENAIRYRRGQEMVPWPNLVFRGHNHKPADSGDNQPGGHPDAQVRAIITPAWQLGTSFAYRIGASAIPVGGLIVTCNEGRFKVHKIYSWPSPGTFASADGWSQATTQAPIQ